MTNRVPVSSSRLYSSPATYSSTLLTILTRTFLLLPSPLFEAFEFLVPRGPGRHHDLATELAREVARLLGADRGATRRTTDRPGDLERLQALHADIAGTHPLDVGLGQRQLHFALDAAVREPDALLDLIDRER